MTQALTNVVRNACEALETVPDRAPVLCIVVDRGLVRTTTDAGRVERSRRVLPALLQLVAEARDEVGDRRRAVGERLRILAAHHLVQSVWR